MLGYLRLLGAGRARRIADTSIPRLHRCIQGATSATITGADLLPRLGLWTVAGRRRRLHMSKAGKLEPSRQGFPRWSPDPCSEVQALVHVRVQAHGSPRSCAGGPGGVRLSQGHRHTWTVRVDAGRADV